MDWNQLIADLAALLEHQVVDIAGTPVSVATVLTVVFVAIAGLLAGRFVRRAVVHALSRRGNMAEGAAASVGRLVQYLVVLVAFGVALETVGVDLSALFAAGAVFAVTIGFAMQSIAQNFVSGVILLAEGSIKPGDVLRVEEHLVRVLDLGIRSTTVEARDGEVMIVPNSILIQTAVKNYTLSDRDMRVRVKVGVSYGSDMKLVFETLERVAHQMAERWKKGDREVQVIMTGFGTSSVDFDVAVWMSEPWEMRVRASELHRAMWDALQQAGITIAFPQVDVHFDPPVSERLAAAAGG